MSGHLTAAPLYGSRVAFDGSETCGAFTGTVLDVYKAYDYAEDDDIDGDPIILGVKPQSEWWVRVEFDVMPNPTPPFGLNLRKQIFRVRELRAVPA